MLVARGAAKDSGRTDAPILKNVTGNKSLLAGVLDTLYLQPFNARVAQLAEHLICNQKVAGSIPVAGSQRIQYTKKADAAQRRLSSYRSGLIGACLLDGHAESLHKIID